MSRPVSLAVPLFLSFLLHDSPSSFLPLYTYIGVFAGLGIFPSINSGCLAISEVLILPTPLSVQAFLPLGRLASDGNFYQSFYILHPTSLSSSFLLFQV